MQLSPTLTYGFFLILIRTSGLLVSAPLLSHKGIPRWTKVGFAIFFAVVLVPVQGDNLPSAPQQMGTVADAALREALFGLALGLAMNLVFMGMQMASRIIGLQMGFGLGGVFDPITGADHGVLDQFYGLIITLVFFVTNGHYIIIQTLAETLKAVPPGSFDPFSIPLNGIPALMAGLSITAVRIAMPVMGALFMADLGLGLVSRTVPQMNVMVVGAPIKIGVGILVISAALPATVHIMNVVIGNSLAGSTQQLLGAR